LLNFKGVSESEGLAVTTQRQLAPLDGPMGDLGIVKMFKLWHWAQRRHGKDVQSEVLRVFVPEINNGSGLFRLVQ
jgi:hypothetical protein